MKQKILLLFIFILTTCPFFAQKEANNWFFGKNIGLDFNNLQTTGGVVDMPTAVTGPINTTEGCFTVSDKDGNLIFSSDGIFVYDKNNNQMPNGYGLKGDPSSSQSGIGVPVPGDLNKYYIISVPNEGTHDGLYYSIVDFSMNGGLGDISVKNQVLFNGDTSENICAVPQSNNIDYWIIHRSLDRFYVWSLTSLGFSSPVVYTIPGLMYNSSESIFRVGYTSVSSDMTRIVNCMILENMIFADFDSDTGILSNIKVRPINGVYRAEFSPSGEWLYLSGHPASLASIQETGLQAVRYADLQNDPNTPLSLISSYNITNLQQHWDGRIYGTTYQKQDLYVMMNPDDGGTDIEYFQDFFNNETQLGLPTFKTPNLNIKVNNPKEVCQKKDILFNANLSYPVAAEFSHTYWDFGDNSPLIKNTLLGNYALTHQYAKPGTYKIVITAYDQSDAVLKKHIFSIKISSCIIPVNHNISVMGYYD